MRGKTKVAVTDLKAHGISHVYLDGNDEVIDILRLTYIEGGMSLGEKPDGIVLSVVGQNYQVVSQDVSRV